MVLFSLCLNLYVQLWSLAINILSHKKFLSDSTEPACCLWRQCPSVPSFLPPAAVNSAPRLCQGCSLVEATNTTDSYTVWTLTWGVITRLLSRHGNWTHGGGDCIGSSVKSRIFIWFLLSLYHWCNVICKHLLIVVLCLDHSVPTHMYNYGTLQLTPYQDVLSCCYI